MTLVPPLKYRKKPVVVDAFHYKGYEDFNLLRLFVGEAMPLHDMGDGKIGITTLEGVMEASPGDWIIKGVKGEFYPCKPDIFAATYERVDEWRPVKPHRSGGGHVVEPFDLPLPNGEMPY